MNDVVDAESERYGDLRMLLRSKDNLEIREGLDAENHLDCLLIDDFENLSEIRKLSWDL